MLMEEVKTSQFGTVQVRYGGYLYRPTRYETTSAQSLMIIYPFISSFDGCATLISRCHIDSRLYNNLCRLGKKVLYVRSFDKRDYLYDLVEFAHSTRSIAVSDFISWCPWWWRRRWCRRRSR